MLNQDSVLESSVARSVFPLTCSGSGQQGEGEGQAQAGDMSRYHRRPPQPHVQPEFPHPQPLSHRAVLHIRPHAAEPRARRVNQEHWNGDRRRVSCQDAARAP